MNTKGMSMNEADFISKLVKLTNQNPNSLSLQDDVAHIDGMIVNTDTTIEGVHILKGLNPKYIAYKAMARSVSDVFAKGGKPCGYFMNIILPKGFSAFDELIKGFEEFTAVHKMDLLGGDTSVHGERIIIAITVLAKVERHITRMGAKVGDGVYITKKIGSAFLGLFDCKNGNTETQNAREYLMPSLVDVRNFSTVNASMDISDGLIIDANRLAKASQVQVAIDFNLLPFVQGNDIQSMLSFGDDYNIVMTSAKFIQDGVMIGYIKAGQGVLLLNCPFEIKNQGFDHFV